MASHFTGAPPPARVRRGEIVRVTTSETQQFCVVSKCFFGQYIHWYGNRSHECTKGKSACNGCERGWPIKFLLYIDVIHLNDDKRVFLELTHTAASQIDKLAPQDLNLRGAYLRIRKTKGGAKGRYLCEVLERRENPDLLPQERDPLETLRFLWKCKSPSVQSSPASL